MNAFPPWCTYEFHTIFTVNRDYLPKSMNLIGLSIETQLVFCQVGADYLNDVLGGLHTYKIKKSHNP